MEPNGTTETKAADRSLLTPEFMARLDTLGMVSRKILAGKLRGERRSRKKGESLLASTPVVVLSAILGRTPTIEEYKQAVEGIELTKFKPPKEEMATACGTGSGASNVELRISADD